MFFKKIVLITGATRGIGYATAVQAAKKGLDIDFKWSR